MSKRFAMTGLVPATFTPMHADGRLHLEQVAPMVERALRHNVAALFVCGTTGESVSLTTAERQATLEAFISASAGRLPIVAHVGHTSLQDARALAAHAEKHGAAAIAAFPPFFFRPSTIDELVSCMGHIAEACSLPFYYYHIPHMTGVALDMLAFLRLGAERIPTLNGIKYTAPTLYEFQSCAAFENGRFNMVFGVDEMLLAGLATGAQGAVGSTYNLAAPLYHEMIRLFAAGEHAKAQDLQLRSAKMVELVKKYRPLPALKSMMALAGIDCGPVRLPQMAMTAAECAELYKALDAIGFSEWMR